MPMSLFHAEGTTPVPSGVLDLLAAPIPTRHRVRRRRMRYGCKTRSCLVPDLDLDMDLGENPANKNDAHVNEPRASV